MRPGIARCAATRCKRGLAVASRGADDDEFMPRVQAAIETIDEVRPRHEVGPSHWDQQPGCQQHRRGRHSY
jgi:hypothetical protein